MESVYSKPHQSTTMPVLYRPALGLLAAVCGLTAANIYYSQPLLAMIAQDFGVPTDQAGLFAPLTQFGFALGLLLIVPLGDSRERKGLILSMLLAVAAALLAIACAPSLPWLLVGGVALGICTIVPQLIIPLVADLTPIERRGQSVGIMLSGLFIGVLLARTVSGLVSAQFGWRAVYAAASVLMLILVILVQLLLPQSRPVRPIRYSHLLQSLVPLIQRHSALRRASLTGALTFGSFNAFWVTLTLLLGGPPYHYSSAIAGLFGLAAAAGAIAAPLVGRWADRRGSASTITAALVIVLIAFGVLAFGTQALPALIVGVILLDLGVQANVTANQALVAGLDTTARSRLNTIFMTTYFLGGAIGSTLGIVAWQISGWWGVCAVGAALGIGALVAQHPNGQR